MTDTRKVVPLFTPFDPEYYRSRYPVLQNHSEDELIEHWNTYGHADGLKAAPTAPKFLPFNPDFYRLKYGDLSNLDDDQITEHWNYHGFSEGRQGAPFSENMSHDDIPEHSKKLYYSNVDCSEIIGYLSKTEVLARLSKPQHFSRLLNIPEQVALFSAPARSFLTKNRIDLVAKYVYAKNFIFNRKTNFPKALYEAHIDAFCGFEEPDGSKTSASDYLSEFDVIIQSIQDVGFRPDKTVLPVAKGGSFIEGSHRLGAALALNQSVPFVHLDNNDFNFDFSYFETRGLDQEYLDYLAHQLVNLDEHTRICLVFPAADDADDQVKSILAEYSELVHYKEIFFNKRALPLLFAQIYWGEKWIGSFENSFASTINKYEPCFDGTAPLRVFLVRSDPTDKTGPRVAKEKIRALYQVGKHSVHMCDTHEESMRLASLFFNENSIHFLNETQFQPFPMFVDGFRRYMHKLNQLPASAREHFALTGSTVLSAYGLRDCQDIDYLSTLDFLNKTPDISNHANQVQYYPTTFDDIIYNPRNHFYFFGYKFVTPEVIYEMKEIRHEVPKDTNDLKILEQVVAPTNKVVPFQPEMKIVALVTYKYDSDYLSDLKDNLDNLADEIIVKFDQHGDFWKDEGKYRSEMVATAEQVGADYIVVIDPDERFEVETATKLKTLMRQYLPTNERVLFEFNYRELYEPDAYRIDGTWGEKTRVMAFRSLPDNVFSDAKLHTPRQPLNEDSLVIKTGLNVYHLKHINPALREHRAEIYKKLDPNAIYNPVGYDYLNDETNMRLSKISIGKEYNPPYKDYQIDDQIFNA